MPTPTFTQITPHIQKLDLPFLGGRLQTGVWLVRDERGWVLVDSGAPAFRKTVIEQVLAATGGQPPYMLVLTHGHLDHAGTAQAVVDLWKIPVAAGRDEIPFLLGPRRYTTLAATNPLHRLAQLSPPALVGRNIQRPLDEGMCLGDMQVYAVPGHSPGMVAFLHGPDRALLCADTFMNRGDKVSDPFVIFTYDAKLNHASQEKLIALDFDHLLPSHGAPIKNNGRARARDFVERRQRKQRK